MTDNELNMKVCEALGWEKSKNWTPDVWGVPIDQPWFCGWDDESCLFAPDFLNNPAECFRLIEWLKMTVRYHESEKLWWCALDWTELRRADPDLKRAVVIAFLASNGVEVGDE